MVEEKKPRKKGKHIKELVQILEGQITPSHIMNSMYLVQNSAMHREMLRHKLHLDVKSDSELKNVSDVLVVPESDISKQPSNGDIGKPRTCE